MSIVDNARDALQRAEAEKQRHLENEKRGREAAEERARQDRARTEAERKAAESARLNNANIPKYN